MPSPSDSDVLSWARTASVEDLAARYRDEVNAPVNTIEEVQAQRWLGLCILGWAFGRGLTADLNRLINDANTTETQP